MTVAATPVYELWDAETGNLIADYNDEASALLAIRENVQEEGSTAWASVMLVCVGADGKRQPIAEGRQLLDRAMGDETPGTGASGAAASGANAAHTSSSPVDHHAIAHTRS